MVLAFVPQAIVDDPGRLPDLVRDAEAAGRLQHPSAVPVLGTEIIADELAVVEAHRPGTTLRALLDAGGRLPPDVAARIVVDACAAVARAHALEVAEGKRLVHGALAPSRIAVGEDGAALVMGFGTGTTGTAEEDVRALAAVLHECLSGEAPARPPASLEEAGVSAGLASAVVRVLGAPPGAAPSAESLAETVAAAGPIASHADVASYVDAILPPGEGARGELARALSSAVAGDAEEVSEDYIVEPTEPTLRAPVAAVSATDGGARPAAEPPAPPAAAARLAPVPSQRPAATPAPRPGAEPTLRRELEALRFLPPEPTPEPLPRPPATRPGADPAGVFAAPGPPPKRSRSPAVVAVLCAVVGFAAGFAAARLTSISISFGPPPPKAAVAPTAPIPAETQAAAAAPAPASTKGAMTSRPPRRSEATRSRPAPSAKKPADRASAKPVEKMAAIGAGKGMLRVAAPEDAEVFLDERLVGRGNVDIEIPVGSHRIEVRRGQARVAERFTLGAGETWTYDVTPTP